jgi:hypothetical protein
LREESREQRAESGEKGIEIREDIARVKSGE